MITGKNVRVEIQKSDASNYTGASGSIEISDDENGKVYFNVDNGPSISVELPDLLETIQRVVTGRK